MRFETDNHEPLWLFDEFFSTFKKNSAPGRYLTFDEGMVRSHSKNSRA